MPARLDLGKVVAGAFLVPWWRRKAFARVLAVPVVLFFGYSLTWESFGAPQMSWIAGIAGTAIYGLLFTVFAVLCHRLVLLDPAAAGHGWLPRWTWRETRFFLWVAALWLAGVAAGWLLLTLVLNVWYRVAEIEAGTLKALELSVRAAMLYAFGRLCLILPAVAVEHDPGPDPRWAWRLTHGNGWRLLIIVGALPWMFSLLLDYGYRSGATYFEWVLVGLAGMALLAVQVAAVSLAYRELTS